MKNIGFREFMDILKDNLRSSDDFYDFQERMLKEIEHTELLKLANESLRS